MARNELSSPSKERNQIETYNQTSLFSSWGGNKSLILEDFKDFRSRCCRLAFWRQLFESWTRDDAELLKPQQRPPDSEPGSCCLFF